MICEFKKFLEENGVKEECLGLIEDFSGAFFMNTLTKLKPKSFLTASFKWPPIQFEFWYNLNNKWQKKI